MASLITITRIAEQFNHIRKTKNVNGRSMRYTCLGILTSLIWVMYMMQNGNNMGLIVVSTSLFLEMYVLSILRSQRKESGRQM